MPASGAAPLGGSPADNDPGTDDATLVDQLVGGSPLGSVTVSAIESDAPERAVTRATPLATPANAETGDFGWHMHGLFG